VRLYCSHCLQWYHTCKTIRGVMHDILSLHESVIISDEICAQIMLNVHRYWRDDFSCRQKPKFGMSVYLHFIAEFNLQYLHQITFVPDILLMPRFMHRPDEMEASRSGMVCPTAVSIPFWRLMMVQKCVLWDFLAMGRYRSLFLFCHPLAN